MASLEVAYVPARAESSTSTYSTITNRSTRVEWPYSPSPPTSHNDLDYGEAPIVADFNFGPFRFLSTPSLQCNGTEPPIASSYSESNIVCSRSSIYTIRIARGLSVENRAAHILTRLVEHGKQSGHKEIHTKIEEWMHTLQAGHWQHITQRLKKVKCGEERPRCARCVRYGAKCTYPHDVEVTRGGSFSTFAVKPITSLRKEEHSYRTGHGSVFWQDMTSRFRSRESPDSSSHTSDHSSSQEAITNLKSFPGYNSRIPMPTKTTLSLVIPGTQAERHLFHYLRVRVLPDTGGSTNHSFWRIAVLSLCHQNSVVRSAALSLGSFHLAKNSANPSHSLKSLKQYHFALQAARNYVSNRTEPYDGPLLIICLLFYVIEATRGEYEAASNHVLAGLKVLRSWNHKDRTRDISKSKRLDEFNEISNRLAGLFSSLDANMTNSSELTHPHAVITSLDERSGLKSCIPMSMNGLAEAAGPFGKLNNWNHHLLASIARISPPVSLDKLPVAVRNELSYLMENMERWETSSDPLILSTQPWGQIADLTCLKVLFMRNKILFHRTLASLTLSPLLIDVNHHFNRLMDMVSMMVESMTGNPEMIDHIKPSLFLSCILSPLTLVGISCRSTEMRKRAVRLLNLWPVEEGFHNGKKLARVLERAMNVSQQEGLEHDEETQLELFRAALIKFSTQETGICLPAGSIFTFPA